MKLPDEFIKDGRGIFRLDMGPIYIRQFGHGSTASYVTGSQGIVPHYTAIPLQGEEAMHEAVSLAWQYAREQRRKERRHR